MNHAVPTDEGQCRLCDRRRRLIEAHIIPKGFFLVLHDASGVPELRTDKPGTYPKRAPIGVYDTGILKSLKLFFLSLLWRASVSTRDFYRRVTTSPFEQELKSMITVSDPGTPEQFAVSIGRFAEPAYRGIFDPHRVRLEGVNYFQFYLGGFVAYIKVDRRAPPMPFAEAILRGGEPITVFRRSRDSKDAAAMRAIAKASHRRGRRLSP